MYGQIPLKGYFAKKSATDDTCDLINDGNCMDATTQMQRPMSANEGKKDREDGTCSQLRGSQCKCVGNGKSVEGPRKSASDSTCSVNIECDNEEEQFQCNEHMPDS